VTRICVIGPSKKYFSGITAYTICLANALAKTNSVSALTIRNIVPRFLYPGRHNIDRQDWAIEFSPEVRVFEGMDWNSPLSWLKAYRFLKKEKPDVIIMAWWTSAVAHMEFFLALANSVSTKAPIILELHEIIDPLEAGKSLVNLYSRVMGRLIMNRTQAFVVHADSVKGQAVAAYHLDPEKVFIVPHGIYSSYYQFYSQESARQELGIKEKFVILNFGLIRKYKGVPLAVQAFNQLPPDQAANTRLVIAGENWGDEEGLEKIVEDSLYRAQITFRAEFVADAEVPRYFSAADVVVLPYLRSAGSGVASIAMAFGKPIIISDLENIKESLKDYQGTLLVPRGDAASITQKLKELYFRRQSGRIDGFSVPDSCGWDNVAQLFQNIIYHHDAQKHEK
jgi:glycosyltransferase involved in cell wall biosynthesis